MQRIFQFRTGTPSLRHRFVASLSPSLASLFHPPGTPVPDAAEESVAVHAIRRVGLNFLQVRDFCSRCFFGVDCESLGQPLYRCAMSVAD